MRRALLVLPLLLVACSSGEEATPAAVATSAPAIAGVEVAEQELTREHVQGPVTYDQAPPIGGDHNGRWLACDVYDEPVPDEFAVHSLEHGAVWLTYAPDLPADQVEALAALAELNQEYVLVSPYDDLASPVVAVAWGLTLEVESAEDPRLAQFVEAYGGGGQGGEPGVPCREGGVSPREARGLLGSTEA